MSRPYRASVFRNFLSGFGSLIDITGVGAPVHRNFAIKYDGDELIVIYRDFVAEAWSDVGDHLRIAMRDYESELDSGRVTKGNSGTAAEQGELFSVDFATADLVTTNH